MKKTVLSFATLILLLTPAFGVTYEKKQKPPKDACPRSCKKHGACRPSGCICDPGWTGVGCTMKIKEVSTRRR